MCNAPKLLQTDGPGLLQLASEQEAQEQRGGAPCSTRPSGSKERKGKTSSADHSNTGMKTCHRKQKQVLYFPTKTPRARCLLEQLQASHKTPNHCVILFPKGSRRTLCVAINTRGCGCRLSGLGFLVCHFPDVGSLTKLLRATLYSLATNHPLGVSDIQCKNSRICHLQTDLNGALCDPLDWRLWFSGVWSHLCMEHLELPFSRPEKG